MRSLGPRYLALWLGVTVSQFGTYIAFVTIPFLVLHIQDLTGEGSNLDFAIAYALETLPTLLIGLLGGVLLDRLHLRPVMIATDLLRASAFFYLAANIGSYGVGTVFVMAFLVGSMTTLFDGAMFSVLPSLIPKDRLPDANSFIAASQQIMFAVGGFAAGILAVVFAGPAAGLFINGLTFVFSAVMLKWVGRVAHHRDPDEKRLFFLTEALDGLRYIWTEPRLRVTTIASAIPNFVMGFIEATFVVLAFVVLRVQSEFHVGVLVLAMGVGGVLGALVAPTVTRRVGLGRALTMGMMLSGVLMFSVMFTSYGPLTIGLMAGWMVGVSVINIPLATIRQHYPPDSMLGRVITASRAIGWATLPVGALLGGWLGATESTYPWVARAFPLLLVGTAIWLFTTVVWTDTFGPSYRSTSGSTEQPVEA